ncbi:MAG: ATP-binding protein, partial [Aquabacterium sp.]
LVTTREVLGIVGEQALALPPLDPTEGETLLRERAAAAGAPPFSRADDAAVTPLVQLLDGLPLAIELAASRMRVMGPAALLPRMNERFKLLVARSGRHDRQATLRATLDWSWELLTEPERSALAQLSVFEGGFTLEAAQAVVDLSDFADDSDDRELHSSMWVVDVVQALVDKSLVRRVGERRFDLLRSVQEYADARLRSSIGHPATKHARRQVQMRHLAYFGKVSEAQATRDRCADLHNLLFAADRAIALDRPDLATPIAVMAWAALKRTGPFKAAVDLAQRILDCNKLTDADRAWTLWVQASAHFHLGKTGHARELLTVATKGAPTRVLAALCRSTAAEVASTQGSFEQAIELVRVAEMDAIGVGDPLVLCKVLMAYAGVLIDCGEFQPARSKLEQAWQLATKAGDDRWAAGIEGNLGAVMHFLGDRASAVQRYRSAVKGALAAGDRRWEGNMRSNLGLVLHEQGQHQAALSELQIAKSLAQLSGHKRLAGVAACNVGLVMDALGNQAGAISSYREAADIAADLDDQRSLAQCRVYLARTLLKSGDHMGAMDALHDVPMPGSTSSDADTVALGACIRARLLAGAAWTSQSDELLQFAQRQLAQSGAAEDCELGREVRSLIQLRDQK